MARMASTSRRFSALGLVAPLVGLIVVASSSSGGCGGGEGGGGAGGSTVTTTTTTTTSTGGSGGATGGSGGATTTTTSTTTTTTSTTTTTTSTGGTGGTGGSGGAPPVCHDCLQDLCKEELDDCNVGCAPLGAGGAGGAGGADAGPVSKVCCRDLQACIDAVCGSLSALGTAQEEGACQVYCQSRYFATKAPHIKLVNCAQGAWAPGACSGCSNASFEFEQCAQTASASTCAAALDACDSVPECVAYRFCTLSCTTAAECIACGAPPGSPLPVGQQLWEDYWKCVAAECVLEEWLPNP